MVIQLLGVLLGNLALYATYGYHLVVPRMVDERARTLIAKWERLWSRGFVELSPGRWRYAPDLISWDPLRPPVARLQAQAAQDWPKYTLTWLPWLTLRLVTAAATQALHEAAQRLLDQVEELRD